MQTPSHEHQKAVEKRAQRRRHVAPRGLRLLALSLLVALPAQAGRAQERPAGQQPATRRPAAQQPAAQQPATQRPATETPAAARPKTEPAATQRPTTSPTAPAEGRPGAAGRAAPEGSEALVQMLRDEAKHRDRLARLDRLAELAGASGNLTRVAEVEQLRAKEITRAQTRRARLEGGVSPAVRERLSEAFQSRAGRVGARGRAGQAATRPGATPTAPAETQRPAGGRGAGEAPAGQRPAAPPPSPTSGGRPVRDGRQK